MPGFKKHYNVVFGKFKSLDAGGPLSENALKNGQVDAADIFTTDPLITKNGWVVLEDPKNNFAAQNVVPLMNKAKATPQLAAALNAVSAKLTTDGLIDLNRQLNSPDKPNVESVAKEWLASNDTVPSSKATAIMCWTLTSGMARLSTIRAPSAGNLTTIRATLFTVNPCSRRRTRKASSGA